MLDRRSSLVEQSAAEKSTLSDIRMVGSMLLRRKRFMPSVLRLARRRWRSRALFLTALLFLRWRYLR